MASSTIDEIQQDTLALSMAHAVVVANDTAKLRGTNVAECLVTVTEETPPPARSWRIHYGPRAYLSRRGGDLIVIVDESKAAVTKVLLGQ
jgi:hypothetical protein